MALPENKAEEEEERKKQQQHKPNVSHLLQQEAIATFMEHIDKYDQVEWLKPKHYTAKQRNLSLLCLVAAGAEECAVLHQMSGTAEDLMTSYLSFSLSLSLSIYIYIYISHTIYSDRHKYICSNKFGTNN